MLLKKQFIYMDNHEEYDQVQKHNNYSLDLMLVLINQVKFAIEGEMWCKYGIFLKPQSGMTATLDDSRNLLIALNEMKPAPPIS